MQVTEETHIKRAIFVLLKKLLRSGDMVQSFRERLPKHQKWV